MYIAWPSPLLSPVKRLGVIVLETPSGLDLLTLASSFCYELVKQSKS